jgi:6-phosphofructokinase 1
MGFEGLVKGDLSNLTARDVGGIIQQAGTFLGTARSAEFMTEEGQKKAVGNLTSLGY